MIASYYYEEIEETDLGDPDWDCLEGDLHIIKVARITSAQERAKAKAYRVANRAEIARKAKIRRRKQRMGVHRKKKRIGTAAAGYSFVMDPKAGPRFSTTQNRPGGGVSSSVDFTPDQKAERKERFQKLRAL